MSFKRRDSIIGLRARLTGWYLGILTASLCLFATVLYVVLADDLQRHHDEELAALSAAFANTLDGASWSEPSLDRLLTAAMTAFPPVVVLNEDDQVVYRSPALRHGPRAAALLPLIVDATEAMSAPRFLTLDPDEGSRLRLLCCAAVGDTGARVHVGNSLGGVSTTLRSIGLLSMAVCMPVVLLVTGFGGWVIARRALRPVDNVTEALRSVQATDLSLRLEQASTDPELSGLVESVNRLLDRLEHAFVELGEFAANASHQLQTPLTVMRGTLEVALEGPPDVDRYRLALKEILDEQQIMTEIIEGLRVLSEADGDQTHLKESVVALDAVCEETVEIITALAEAKDIEVSSSLARGLCIRGDAKKLRQVLLSLGDNAVKYTPRSGRIEVSLIREGDEARLRVTDNGIGIGAADLSKVFHRFFRAQGQSRQVPGTGLGLAIVKRLVELHGGRVEAISREGRGSTFTVHLPLA